MLAGATPPLQRNRQPGLKPGLHVAGSIVWFECWLVLPPPAVEQTARPEAWFACCPVTAIGQLKLCLPYMPGECPPPWQEVGKDSLAGSGARHTPWLVG
jgi:hypothetical protein